MKALLSSLSTSSHKLTKLSLANAFFYALLLLGVFILLIHATIIAIRSELVESFAENNFSRIEQVTFQMQKGLILSQDSRFPPCSSKDLEYLREIKQTYFLIGDLGRVSNNKIVCTAQLLELESPIELPSRRVTSSQGFDYRNSQTQLFATDKNKAIISYQNTVAFISPTYLQVNQIYHSKIKSLAGVSYFNNEQHYIYSYFGNILPVDIPLAINHKNTVWDWLPIPNRMLSKTLCNPSYNVCLTAINTKLGLYSINPKYNAFFLPLLFLFTLFLGLIIEYIRVGPSSFIRKLKNTIHHDNIYPVYQPQICISSHKTIGVESLARWNDTQSGMISPELFISVAEDNQLIEQLTKNLTTKIFNELHPILEMDESFTVSINISTELLTSDSFIKYLNNASDTYKFKRNQIILEVTERKAGNRDKMASFSKKLKSQGYLVSLDDFGTGVSNLSWLSTLEPNEIKIDKSFTHAIETDTVNSISLEGIFRMLEHLDVNIVFEGIETKAQRDFIYDHIPNAIGQGWLFAKPKKIDELKTYLNL